MRSFVTATFLAANVLMGLCTQAAETNTPPKDGDYVVLLHGMGRTAVSMKLLEHYFTKRGYNVINVSYHSRRLSVQQLADGYLQQILEERVQNKDSKVHFVTHSLGGIIVRKYLSNHKIQNLGRVVMLAPPNHGSEIIDHLKANCITRNMLGVAARELCTGQEGLPAKLGPVGFPCGVIAGDRSLNPFLSCLLPGANDGKVTVASTRVDGMQDFLVVHGTHTWLMCKYSVMADTLRFVQCGHFRE